jgi:predicted kinase
MSGKLILTHGVPGSGKDTLVDSLISKDPTGSIKVNRDDIRTTLFGEGYNKGAPDKKSEGQVSQVHQQLIKEGLASGKDVYVSDTNLNARFLPEMHKIAKDYGADLQQIYVDTSLEECKKRNKARGDRGGRRVPDHVLERMASTAFSDDGQMKEFVFSSEGRVSVVDRNTPGMKLVEAYNEQLVTKNPMQGKALVLVDVDGTLAANSHEANQAFGTPGKKKDFDYFYRSIEQSKVNQGVVDLANRMRANDGLNLVILTGREDSHAKELLSFIDRSGINVSRVICKREGDYRPDSDFKKEQLSKLKQEGFALCHSIDDRERSVRIYEAQGIMVSRVEEHTPEDPATAPESYPEPRINTIYGSGHCIRCGSKLKDSSKSIGPKCATKS